MKRLRRPRAFVALLVGLATGAVAYALPLQRPRAVLSLAPIPQPTFNAEYFRLWFSPDSRWLITQGDVQEDEDDMGSEKLILWEVATGTQRVVLSGDEYENLCSLAYAPDGQTVAGLSRRGWVTVWELDTGCVRSKYDLRWKVTATRFAELIYTPQGRLLARERHPSGGIWDVTSACFLVDLPALPEQEDRDDRNGWLAPGFRTSWEETRTCVHRLGTDRIWDIPVPAHTELLGRGLSGDGQVLVGWDPVAGVSRSYRGLVYDRDAKTWRRLPQLDKGGASLSHDGRWVAAMHENNEELPAWYVWLTDFLDIPRQRRTHLVAVEVATGREDLCVHGILLAAFAPDGATLAVVNLRGQVELWDFPARTPWTTMAVSAILAGGVTYVLAILRSRRRGKPEAKP
jgi:WD40 repeat protein